MKQISGEIFVNTISSCTVGIGTRIHESHYNTSSNSNLYELLINSFWISHNHAYYVHRSLLYSTLYDIIEHIIISIINNSIIDTYIVYDKYILYIRHRFTQLLIPTNRYNYRQS